MAADTPDRSEGDIEPSESTEAARRLRDVLAADRGVDLVAIEAARRVAAAEARAAESSEPAPVPHDATSSTKRRAAVASVAAVAVLAIGGYAMASPADSGDPEPPDVLAAVPTTGTPAPSTTSEPPTVEITIPPTTVAATTAAPTTVPPTTAPAASAAPPERGAVYRDGQLILQGAVPDRDVAEAFIAKASEVIGADNVIDHYVIDPDAEIPTDGRVVVDDPVLFATGSTEVSRDFHGLLDLGVAVMTLNPQVVMVVEGHTDEVGTTGANQRLSEARARSVVAYIADKGIDPSRFEVIGRGETDPVAPNDTPEGRRQNRRIEVQLVNLLIPEP